MRLSTAGSSSHRECHPAQHGQTTPAESALMKFSGNLHQGKEDWGFSFFWQEPCADDGESGGEGGESVSETRPGQEHPSALRGGAEEVPGPARGENLARDVQDIRHYLC